MSDLAKRAVACQGWRWMPGMRIFGGATVVAEDAQFGWIEVVVEGQGRVRRASITQIEPDTDHPATRGCLLELVRRAWDDEGLRAEGTFACGEWRWRVHGGKHHGSGFARMVVAPDYASEAEALVAALEACNV